MDIRKTLFLAAGLAALATPAFSQDAGEALELRFGVYTTDKPTTVYRQFIPVLSYLETDLEQRLDRPVGIKIEIHKTYDEALQAFVDGKVDFVRFGPASYVLAERANPDIQLLAMELKKGQKTFEGYIITRTDSGIETLADLKGKRFAFGDPNSTIGRYLAQAELVEAGVFARDLADYAYLGRHDLVARAVQLGDYEAGSLKSSTYKKANARNDLRILHRFTNVTKPWIGRSGLDGRIVEALSQSLVQCQDEEVLAGFKVSGFASARATDYDPVRQGMARAEKEWGDYKLTRVHASQRHGEEGSR